MADEEKGQGEKIDRVEGSVGDQGVGVVGVEMVGEKDREKTREKVCEKLLHQCQEKEKDEQDEKDEDQEPCSQAKGGSSCSRKRKRISLAEYDEDIRQFVSMRLAPQAIAFQLRQKHCLPEENCTPAQVSNRIQTLRRKCRIVPVQITTSSSSSSSSPSSSSSRAALACVPIGRDDDDELIDDICVTECVQPDENFRNSILEQSLTNVGMFFSKETKDSMIVYFNRTHFGCALRLAPVKANGLLVHFDSVHPPSQLFEDTFPRTGLKSVEKQKATMSVTVPSSKPLDVNKKPELILWPSEEKTDWIVVILKFDEPQTAKSEIVFSEKTVF